MHKRIIPLSMAALLVSCCMNHVLRAEELVFRDDFFLAKEPRHQWINEKNGRTGILKIQGALLISPCTLATNEVTLSESLHDTQALKLKLIGCGGGDKLIDYISSDSFGAITLTESAQLIIDMNKYITSSEESKAHRYNLAIYNGTTYLTYLLHKPKINKDVNNKKNTKDTSHDNNLFMRIYMNYE
ncbi:pilus-assembly fibrillin subunit [Escherichia coli]|uniref:pilus-assembly fibrillin subunit n=1 Tax=Escherichia coli TaxID=562 RepID=UPI000BE8C915|nr:pilus-assembly fibrillin subunit [Escherichia coli]